MQGIAPPGYRLPVTTHLGAVHLQVSDLARSLDYYQRTLGLHPVTHDRTHASLGPLGASRALLHLHTKPGTHPAPRGGRLGLYHFALLVPDRAALGRFVTHLAEADAPVASADHAVSEALYLWDPDGLGIEVYVGSSAERVARSGAGTLHDDRAARSPEPGHGGRGSALERHAAGDRARSHASPRWGSSGRGGLLSRALGFDKTVWSYPGALFLSAGGYHHHLGTNTWAAGAPPGADDEARLLEWEIVLASDADRDAAADSCEAAGYTVVEAAASRVVTDPWGTTLRLISSGVLTLIPDPRSQVPDS